MAKAQRAERGLGAARSVEAGRVKPPCRTWRLCVYDTSWYWLDPGLSVALLGGVTLSCAKGGA